MIVQFVPMPNVDEVWPFIGKFLHDGIEKNPGNLTASDLWTMCRSGNAFLMTAHDSTGYKVGAVFRFETWRDGAVFKCLALGGDGLEEWLPAVVEKAIEMAAEGRATKLVTNGRPGWQRVIPGLKPIYTAFELEI